MLAPDRICKCPGDRYNTPQSGRILAKTEESNMSEWISLLLIDDDEQFLELVEYSLRLAGFKVLMATNGRKGLKLARKKRPDVILLDVTMPEMDGLEVLSELKHDKKTADIPVFMLTARNLVGQLEQAFKIGADDYITKPVEVMALGDIVKRKLEKFRMKIQG